MLNTIKKALPNQTVVAGKGKDVIVKSKNREAAKKELEQYFTKKKVLYTSVFKKSKSASIEVLSVEGIGDVIFKPIIAKGAGGLKFEKEVELDLNNYFNGAEYKELIHPDVIEALESEIGLKRRAKFEVVPEGKKNQKRLITFNGKKLTISNSSGATLTDLTLKKGNSKTYLSLKMSSTYYTLNASIYQYFLDKTYQKSINEYFGFNGQLMGGFGKEYGCITDEVSYTKVKNNLSSILDQALGHDVVIVHKKSANDVMVKDVSTNKVSVSGLSDESYRYPEAGVRKYANIKFSAKINGYDYEVNFQFRGTTPTDTGPKYLRILLERL